ncbi:unnamed protein product [Schistosoma margrebowiei]|uniref:Alpha-1,3/1,6-mannosyltransferase ALG2 n=1 Tax=Schistosoma margrebowiei TaxID=48269 RepID=A0A183LM03_9TREM|nr:unnamed protein product [Schistosoma margrebowiei]
MPKQIVFLHPDLGIGGAERLIVDSAVALESCGYNVSIITNHHDPKHCFEETLQSNLSVTVVADWFPRSIFGYMTALCAYIRLILATLYLLFYEKKPDVTFVDQISAPMILLRAFGYKLSTGMADIVLVNSKFTSNVFRETFTSLNHVQLRILYPIANEKSLCLPTSAQFQSDHQSKYEYRKYLSSEIIPERAKIIFVSINRYERKKNLSLALYSLEYLITHWDQLIDSTVEIKPENVHLIIAGGYDRRVIENVEYYTELVNLSQTLKVSENVTFMCSCSSEIKPLLIASSDAVIYTPDKEHFGIVPIEAMSLSRAVIALDSGGPKETVLHGSTGFLCTVHPIKQLPQTMATYLSKFVNDPELADRLGKAGCERVREKFSSTTFKRELQTIVSDLISEDQGWQ